MNVSIAHPAHCSISRSPLPHKIYIEGEYDELHGKGNAGREKQESINELYNILYRSNTKSNLLDINNTQERTPTPDNIEGNTTQREVVFADVSSEKREEVVRLSQPNAKGALKELDELQDDLQAASKELKEGYQSEKSNKAQGQDSFEDGSVEGASINIKEFVDDESEGPVTPLTRDMTPKVNQ